jgi:predicted DNA-binding transcriptional regulator AlpA
MPKFDKPLKMTAHRIDQENPQGFEQAIGILAHWLVEDYRRKQAADPAPMRRSAPDATQVMSPSDSTGPKLLDIEGLSRYLSMPKSTIYSWVCLQKFPPKVVVRLGRSLRFDRVEIDAWIEQQKAR